MHYGKAVLSLLVLVSTVYAEPPTVEIPKDQLTPVNGYVIMQPKGNAKAVTYISLSNAYPLPSAILKDPKQFVLSTNGLANGTYSFIAVGSLNDEHTVVPFSILIGGQPNPNPNPNPNPQPNPNPNPVSAVGWLIVIEETSTRTPETAKVLSDVKFWESLPVKGWRFYDPSRASEDATKRYFVNMANEKVLKNGGSYPVLMFVDPNGMFVKGVPLPKDTATIRQMVKETFGQ